MGVLHAVSNGLLKCSSKAIEISSTETSSGFTLVITYTFIFRSIMLFAIR